MWVTPNEFIAVMLRDAQRDLPPPKQLYALMCIEPIWAQNCPVPHVRPHVECIFILCHVNKGIYYLVM